MVTHAQPVFDSLDLGECEAALAAFEREDEPAMFSARHVPVQEIHRADGHNPQPDPRC